MVGAVIRLELIGSACCVGSISDDFRGDFLSWLRNKPVGGHFLVGRAVVCADEPFFQWEVGFILALSQRGGSQG